MHKITFTRTYVVEKSTQSTEFSHYVSLTAKLLNRPYIIVFKMVEDWELHKIIRRYNEALRCEIPSQYWFGMRKKDKTLQ